jgi:hypothetical protein
VLDGRVAEVRERPLELGDRAPRVSPPEGQLAETSVNMSSEAFARGSLEQAVVEPLGVLEVSKPKGDLGLDQRRAQLVGAGVRAGRQVVLRHAQLSSELAQKLEGGDAVAGFDPRDVGRGAARERQPALAQSRLLAGGAQAFPYLAGIIDVG